MKRAQIIKILIFLTLVFSINDIYAQCTDGTILGTPTINDPDGDGLNNICDLDDDNDGILDVDESPELSGDLLLNGGVNGPLAQIVPPPSWEVVPFGDPLNQSTGVIQSTVDTADATGPNANLGVLGIPQEGSTFITGLHVYFFYDFAPPLIYHEGIQQTVSLVAGTTYTVTFYQSNVQQNGVEDGTGVWRVYLNLDEIFESEPTIPNGGPEDPNLTWVFQSFTFSPTVSGDQLLRFMPFDDDADFIDESGVRLGLDNITLQQPGLVADTDGDGYDDRLDIDSDDDGIPDNVEAQSTIGYIAPSGNGTIITDLNGDGVDDNYDLDGPGISTLEDTDGDGIFDFIDSDSDNDGTPDIQENGMANSISGTDTDGDGLNNVFETTNTNDPILDVNEDIENPTDLSILPDTDGDLVLGGDLDYRDIFDVNPPYSASIDFDGVDDFIDSNLDLSGQSQATVMVWIKLDPTFSNAATILNQGDFELLIDASRELSVKVNNATLDFTGNTTVNLNEWTHITLVYNSSLPSEKLKVYFNGNPSGVSNATELSSTITSSSELFTIGKKSNSDANYFKGDIDEVRIFDITLTEDQMRKILYQEIVEYSGSVSGITVPKTIVDFYTSATIPWANLRAYYPMTDILSNKTSDFSGNGYDATLHYITTVLEQTAPMPFQTSGDGNWTDESNWLYGNVWNLTELTDSGYSIVKISNDVTINSTLKTLGLLLDSGETLTMDGDNELNNSWYLGLDGTIDLKNDSQLVQGKQSDLVTSADGAILRRQEGQSNVYRYNYWSSPVGVKLATSYVDNNSMFNSNPNNTPFTLNMLKDTNGDDVQFTNDYHEDGKISAYWLYSFVNGVTYYDWSALNINTPLVSGLGYTQKGGGSLSDYIFEGKPNNGTVIINATDTGGTGSEGGISKTEYLVGNPYPSAIDGHQFIIDNASTIGGEIYLWEQWAGNSHNLAEYQGGYAVMNLLDQVNAYQFQGLNGGNTGSQDGLITPKRYLPVGQGFMVEVKFDGEIKFLNTQRIFKKEQTGETVFFRTTNNTEVTTSTAPAFQKIRLNFKTNTDLGRELVLGFSDSTTDGFDYGYDAKAHETNANDLTIPLGSDQMVMQAFSAITSDKEVDLNFKSNGAFTYTIEATQLENIDATQEVYLRDNLTGIYHDLRSGLAYSFSSDSGTYNNRFDLVFQSEQALLSNEEFDTDNTLVYYSNTQGLLFVKGLTLEAKDIILYNTLGQEVYNNVSISNQQLENGINISDLSKGVYVVSVQTENNQTIDKKVIIN